MDFSLVFFYIRSVATCDGQLAVGKHPNKGTELNNLSSAVSLVLTATFVMIVANSGTSNRNNTIEIIST
jgi:hypothetical protein